MDEKFQSVLDERGQLLCNRKVERGRLPCDASFRVTCHYEYYDGSSIILDQHIVTGIVSCPWLPLCGVQISDSNFPLLRHLQCLEKTAI